MLNINKKQTTSPASKKPSQEGGKVGREHRRAAGRGAGRLPASTPWTLTFFAPLQGSSEKPKRPVSAMFIFSEEKRRQLQEERPELSESELTRLLARMWNDLSEKKKVRPARPGGCQASECGPPLLWGLARPRPCPVPATLCLGADAGAGSPASRKEGRREAVSCGLLAPGGAALVGGAEPSAGAAGTGPAAVGACTAGWGTSALWGWRRG